jgi:cardiolipin synthase
VRGKRLVTGIAAGSILTLAGCGAHPATVGTHSSAQAKPSAAASFRVMVDPEDEYDPGTNIIDGNNPIYRLITSARTTLDMTMYGLDDFTAAADLAADAARGVTVRVVLDGSRFDNPQTWPDYLYQDNRLQNYSAYEYLAAHHVHVVWASSDYEATHQATITVDDSTSAIMTGDMLTDHQYEVSRDFTIMDTDKADVTAIEAVFDADYAHATVTPSDADHLVWGPAGSESRVLALINSARHTLSVETAVMGDAAITSALIRAARRGVDVTLTMTDYRSTRLSAAGVHLWSYVSDDTTVSIHANVIIADGSTMFVGSQNFSIASLTKSRELGVVTTDSTLIARVSSALALDHSGKTQVHPTDG